MRMRLLETRIPPLFVMALMGVAALGAAHFFAALSLDLPLRTPVAVALAAAGVALNTLPKLAFRRVRTSVNPL